MALEEYRRKRDFRRTPEPAGGAGPPSSGGLYVIQKHQSRRLHYDLRLELDGVLLSWALPKGPSLDPTDKRLAVRVEDHPIEYGDFEGVIPEGEYGGGTVMLWDRGEWSADAPAGEGIHKGKLKFKLFGRKLRGGWTLVQMKGEASDGGKNWLLIKERDDHARREDEYCIVDEEPFSVATQRAMPQIAADRDRVWSSATKEELPGAVAGRSAAIASIDDAVSGIARARKGPMPKAMAPQRPATAAAPPDGDDWVHEIKYDGLRLVCFIRRDDVRLVDADGADRTQQFLDVARALATLTVDQAVLDGVATVLNAAGISNRAALEEAIAAKRTAAVTYHLFDAIFAQSHDLRRVPLIERKSLLKRLLDEHHCPGGVIVYGDHIRGHGPTVLEQAVRLGAPGIVSKRADSAYGGRRSRDWLCIDCRSLDAKQSGNDGAGGVAGRAAVVVEPGLEVHGVRVTHPDRILYPEDRVTKRALVRYYEAAADWILPHVANRPISFYRCPEGYEKECFFQKHLEGVSAKELHRTYVTNRKGEKEAYVWIDDVAGLIIIAQWSVLEIHPWGSRVDNVDKPDRLIFDLDPGDNVDWPSLVEGAREVRDVLAEVGLRGFVKTSGGKGLHIVVPIVRRIDWDEAKDFTRAVAQTVVKRDPGRYLATMTKSKRHGRIFLDYFRNIRGATCVAAYSTRARAGAPVSAPLSWDELDAGRPCSTLDHILRRLATLREDPWDGFHDCRQSITAAMKKHLAGR